MQHPIQIDSAGGEYMDSVVVLEWSVPVGSAVRAGDTVVTVETAKAATEVPALVDGWLSSIAFEAGQEAPLGAVLGYVADSLSDLANENDPAGGDAAGKTAVGNAGTAGSLVPQAHQGGAAPGGKPAAGMRPDPAGELERLREGRLKVSPLARRVAAQSGVDLVAVTGTGPGGRIKRADVDAAARGAVGARPSASPPRAASASRSATAAGLHAVDGSEHAKKQAPISPTWTPIVLIHGFGADRSSWRQVSALLDGNHPLVVPELPGHGQAEPRSARTVEDLAHAVAERLHELGVETAHVVGHSLGGAVAATLVDLGLVSARSLCLIAPGGLGPEINTGFLRGLSNARTAEALQPWLETMVAEPSALPGGYARAVMRQREAAGNGQALVDLADALFGEGTQTPSVSARLGRLDMPTKVIWGRRDRVIPVSHSGDLPGHFGLHLLSGVGHVPQLEAPALVARLVNELVHSAEESRR